MMKGSSGSLGLAILGFLSSPMYLGLLLGIGKIEYLNIQELQAICSALEIIGKIEGITVDIAYLNFLHLLKQIHHWVGVFDLNRLHLLSGYPHLLAMTAHRERDLK